MSMVDWIGRWNEGNIGFHEGKPNDHLVAHFAKLQLTAGARVFVPLCGKTVDIHWLLGADFGVVGAELSTLAIGELFDELGVAPTISEAGKLTRYSADGIEIFAGDLFELTVPQVGSVDAVYDRAAFVALPQEMRERYVSHVADLSAGAPQLLITYRYDESLMEGPPFNTRQGEVAQRYGGRYHVKKLDEAATGGVRGVPADEHVWLLTPH